MKYKLNIVFLFLTTSLYTQTIVFDTVYIKDTIINEITYFQEVYNVRYDDGSSKIDVGARLDSITFINKILSLAQDAMLPISKGVELLTNPQSITLNNGAPAGRQTHNYYSDVLKSITNKSYFDWVIDTTNTTSYIQKYHDRVWRIFYDSLGTSKDFYVYYRKDVNVGREVTNGLDIIQGAIPIFVHASQDRRIRFFPYNQNFAKVALLVRDEQNNLIPLYTPLKEVRRIRKIVNEEGIDAGRFLYVDKDFELRMVSVSINR